ncbi:MAG: molybdopterin molybdotransferase MoeA [Armatimonadota bacterium]|nr:molybdopterin molybdotransferase MoeA [Armatimonadota bacterium]MDR7452384.1 molybdopterin molybdotransferase MoeA [Armatimonadota bacterium]MDR7466729.1 molybdopterin molybdotransferase MoeA [Armatimonadota bacterium]MDR7492797.1 molybdopterin molybdotransferase MoeA [Armatimonadota bacterium]MDR7498573.1 molybdopterin molybdotransferase MoeA [Armatimonadota bacterium]
MKTFQQLLSPAEARAAFARVYTPRPLGAERVELLRAYGRVLAEEIRAATDLPAFDRSTVDGYAVRAADTAEASRGAPVPLVVAGEVSMGRPAPVQVGRGQAVRIPTGGAIPAGADAVVMQEHTVRRDGTVYVERPVAPGENLVRRGEDVRAGEVVLARGRRLRPQDLGLLAGLGRAAVEVFLRPRVAVVVTGDELLPPGAAAGEGQIYDMNTYTLAGLIEAAGGLPVCCGIVGDNLQLVVERARSAHRSADAVILAGGSSVGERDVVADAIAALGDPGIVVHGIAIRPGKPTVLAVADGKPVFGLPGNVVSAMVIFDQFVRPVVEALAGAETPPTVGRLVCARLAATLRAGDREDHVRVTLEVREGTLWATPLPGGSAIITSMVRADGVVVVPAGAALAAGQEVEVRLFGP